MREATREQYKEFWVRDNAPDCRKNYYDRLYSRLKSRIEIPSEARVLDVAGGDGSLLSYLGVKRGDVLDISESGLRLAAEKGFTPVEGDVESAFPVQPGSYDVALMFEVLEHLRHPLIPLVEVSRALRPGGLLYVGQPNMRADGVHHVRRIYPAELINDIIKTGYRIHWVDYVPAYGMRDAILDDIRRNPSWLRKTVQSVNLSLSLLPYVVRYRMARALPARFALIAVVCAERAR